MNMDATPKPMITTIIPTYRRSQQLKQAVHSVLAQTYPYFQICVYDNASGDETASIITEMAKADSRIKYFCHKENIGAFNNFQFGLKHVETPFFSFLSDDDFILPDFYETALAGFESYQDAMFSATDVIHVGMHGNILKRALETWTPRFYYPPNGLMAILEHGHSEWTGILFRKGIIEVVGLLDQKTGKFSDLDFTLRIAARFPFVVSKRPCAVFDLSESQTRPPYLFDVTWPGVLNMIRNITEDKSLPLDVRSYAERVLLGKFEAELFELGVSYLSRGYPIEARKVATLLRDKFGRWARYLALSTMINTHQYVPFARSVFSSLVACRRNVRTKRVQRKQKHYGEIRNLVAAEKSRFSDEHLGN
jgi:glycosyltransferase involved in cell wall biosynthesis